VDPLSVLAKDVPLGAELSKVSSWLRQCGHLAELIATDSLSRAQEIDATAVSALAQWPTAPAITEGGTQ